MFRTPTLALETAALIAMSGACYAPGVTYDNSPYKRGNKRFRSCPDNVQVQRDNNKRERFTREEPKPGRNDVCPCGSGKKNKRCCGMDYHLPNRFPRIIGGFRIAAVDGVTYTHDVLISNCPAVAYMFKHNFPYEVIYSHFITGDIVVNGDSTHLVAHVREKWARAVPLFRQQTREEQYATIISLLG